MSMTLYYGMTVDVRYFSELTPADVDRLHREVHRGFLWANPGRSAEYRPGTRAETWCHALLPDEVWEESTAVHEAVHVVLAHLVGLTPTRVSLAGNRVDSAAGGYSSVGTADAQEVTLVSVGAVPYQLARLQRAGHTHPELGRCLRELCGLGDLINAQRLVADGYITDIGQALVDAAALLADPAAQAAVDTLTRELLAERRLDQQQIHAVLNGHRLRKGRRGVWIPGRRLPILPASPSRPLPRGLPDASI
ncbi:hypothetical protein [Streptomyces laurentii]|uniref:hypothetical protein n=1 Tax=Streptomyces laurentii TaxID=39478 RepID=UPI0033D91AC5